MELLSTEHREESLSFFEHPTNTRPNKWPAYWLVAQDEAAHHSLNSFPATAHRLRGPRDCVAQRDEEACCVVCFLAGVSRCESSLSELGVHEQRSAGRQRAAQRQQPPRQRGHAPSFLGAVGTAASTMQPCPVDARDNEGTVESPNFPDTYPPNTDCFSVLRVRPGDVVALSFETLFMERNPRCSSDYVEVLDGATLGET